MLVFCMLIVHTSVFLLFWMVFIGKKKNGSSIFLSWTIFRVCKIRKSVNKKSLTLVQVVFGLLITPSKGGLSRCQICIRYNVASRLRDRILGSQDQTQLGRSIAMSWVQGHPGHPQQAEAQLDGAHGQVGHSCEDLDFPAVALLGQVLTAPGGWHGALSCEQVRGTPESGQGWSELVVCSRLWQ